MTGISRPVFKISRKGLKGRWPRACKMSAAFTLAPYTFAGVCRKPAPHCGEAHRTKILPFTCNKLAESRVLTTEREMNETKCYDFGGFGVVGGIGRLL